MDVCLRVNRIADFAKLGQHFTRVLPDEKRAVVSAGNARDQRIEIGRNPDRMTMVFDQLARLLIQESAATGCNDLWDAFEQAADHASFAVAKIFFAKSLEYFRDAHSGGGLDFIVRIDKIHSKLRSQ